MHVCLYVHPCTRRIIFPIPLRRGIPVHVCIAVWKQSCVELYAYIHEDIHIIYLLTCLHTCISSNHYAVTVGVWGFWGSKKANRWNTACPTLFQVLSCVCGAFARNKWPCWICFHCRTGVLCMCIRTCMHVCMDWSNFCGAFARKKQLCWICFHCGRTSAVPDLYLRNRWLSLLPLLNMCVCMHSFMHALLGLWFTWEKHMGTYTHARTHACMHTYTHTHTYIGGRRTQQCPAQRDSIGSWGLLRLLLPQRMSKKTKDTCRNLYLRVTACIIVLAQLYLWSDCATRGRTKTP